MLTRRWSKITAQVFVIALVIFGQLFFSITTFAQGITDGPLRNNQEQNQDLPRYKDSGVENSIRDYLCTPTGLGSDLYDCIGKAYRFSIAFGVIALVFFMVLAGYLYISGGETGKKRGKEVLFSAFTGMGIILSSFILLRFINPTLVEIRPIQPPIFSNVNLPSCEEIGFSANCIISTGQNAGQVFTKGDGKAYGGRGCDPITNDNSPASITNLKKTCWGKYGDDVVRKASIVAANESGGRPIPVGENSCPGSRKARCSGGEIPVYGVFQINLAAHKVVDASGQVLNCPSAFTKGSLYFCSRGCTVTNKALYDKCFAAVTNIKTEMDTACKIYEGRNNTFAAWGNKTNEHGKKCGF